MPIERNRKIIYPYTNYPLCLSVTVMISKFVNSFFTKNKTAFFTFLIFGCICGAFFRNEREWWDFANYHYYNAWAFLNDRLNVDIVPAFINTFFSPFIELPAYFLTNALNDHPVIFSTIMAVPYGLLLFVVYKIAALFFSPDTMEGKVRIGLTVSLYIGSDTVLSQVSATTHEHFVSFLVLVALYPLLKGIKEHHLSIKSCLSSNLYCRIYFCSTIIISCIPTHEVIICSSRSY